MPYIRQDIRQEINKDIAESIFNSPGELNYAITKILTDYIKQHGLSYSTINDIVGALEGSKMEFYRRVAVPYENKKINENGDVYEN